MVVAVRRLRRRRSSPARRARACRPTRGRFLKQADGAFVGRLVDREDIGAGRVRLRFEVERAVKGHIGATVEVVTANNSAACGIETADRASGSASSSRARAGAGSGRSAGRSRRRTSWPPRLLPPPNGTWPAAMFVGGRFGPGADARARRGGSHARATASVRGTCEQLAACPGGRRVVELVSRGSRSRRCDPRAADVLAHTRAAPSPPA